MADALGGELIERDRIAEAAAARMRRGGEEAVVRRVAAIHIGMRHAAENGEFIAVLAQLFQIRRERVVAPGLLGKKLLGYEAEVVAHGEDAARREHLRVARESRHHGIEEGQRESHAGAAQKLAPRTDPLGGDEGARIHLFWKSSLWTTACTSDCTP